MAIKTIGGRQARPLRVEQFRTGMLVYIPSYKPNQNEYLPIESIEQKGDFIDVKFKGGRAWMARPGEERYVAC